MARPEKQGLDYFPFDVDFFEDEKIAAISGEFNIKGEITVIKLLCAIYRNGYFIVWSDMLKMKLLKDLPGVSADLLDCIVNRLVRWEFFDKALFNSEKILTSKGIQSRYFQAAKRRKLDEITPHLLITIPTSGVNAYNNSLPDELMYTKTPQSKGKESKYISTNVDNKPPTPLSKKMDVKIRQEERKKVAQKKEIDLSFAPQQWQKLLCDWLEYRKEIKHPLTQKSIGLFYTKLMELSGEDGKTARKIIEQSIANGWQGIFNLKNENRSGNISEQGDEQLMQSIASGYSRGLQERKRIRG